MDYFLEVYAVCDDEMLTEKIDHIKDKLVSTLDNTGYEYRVTILDSPVVNAFALPGGDFVIFNGLIKKSTRPEELAGVMAHEIQHIEQRHTTKLLVKDKLFEFILTSGEGSSQGVESTLQIARVLGGLAYRRAEESAADAQGLKMLIEAQIDPNGMKDFFKIMEAEYGKMPALFKYISTHPDVGERIETLDTMIRRSSFTPKKL
ncbi:MAG: M48 family metalloprotease, partial [Candidatus Dadabacteria bacterium]|nr:M48 family metalloprotease [Candidatus Dadabacteria bacterium]